MSLVDDLRAARAEIDTPEKWKRERGDDGPGTPCCVMVAVHRVSDDGRQGDAMWLALRDQTPGYKDHSTVGRFNDHPATTHADIMALFDRAIAAAEATHA